MKDEEDAIIEESKELMEGLNNKLGLSNEEKRLSNLSSSSQKESKEYKEDLKQENDEENKDDEKMKKNEDEQGEKKQKVEGMLDFDDDE